MRKIAVVTDSTATIPDDLAKKYDIRVAPLHITWDKVRYRDGVDLTQDEFYKRIRVSKTLPTTSGAIQGEFLQIFEDLKCKCDGIVAATVTGALSAGFSAANNAKDMVQGVPIEVIDSKLATMGLGFGAIAAAKVSMAGGDIQEVAQAAKEVFDRVHVYFALDTFEFLRRGGRVSLTQAAIASLLQIKPIMMFNKEGKIVPAAKTRTMPKAIEGLIKFIETEAKNTPLHMSIMHGGDLKAAERIKEKIVSRFKCEEVIITGLSPVVGTHFGPGALCIAFYYE